MAVGYQVSAIRCQVFILCEKGKEGVIEAQINPGRQMIMGVLQLHRQITRLLKNLYCF